MCSQQNCHNTIKSQHCGDSPLFNEGKTQKTKSRLPLNHRDLCWHSIAMQHKRVHTKQQRYLACIWLFTKLLGGAPPTQCKTTRRLPILNTFGHLAVHYNENSSQRGNITCKVNACVLVTNTKPKLKHNEVQTEVETKS